MYLAVLHDRNLVGFQFSADLGTILKSGFDAIIIEGISSSPVYLYVNNRDIQIRDASHLWGLSTSQTINTIAKENGLQQASCCSIGQAGEIWSSWPV